MCERSPLQQTAADVVANATIIAKHDHSTQPLHHPVAPGSPAASVPEDVVRARAALLEAALRIQQLVWEPSEFLSHTVVQQQQFACLHWLCHFRIPSYVPFHPGSLSYADIAQAAGVPETTLRSVARMAMTADFFRETAAGDLAHTRLSASIGGNRDLYNWMMYMANRTVPTMSKFVNATEQWGDSTKKTETAYNLAMGTELSFFEHINSRPELNEEFGAYMKSQASSLSGTNVEFLLQGFDWAGRGEATVVDVGGGGGDASIALAKAYPKLSFIVQDLSDTIHNAQKRASVLPDSISQRIQFHVHDFFTIQPVKDADVYLLRMILHDWPHAEAVSIIKNLVRAMKAGARIVIMDMVLPAPGTVPRTFEAMLRQKDLTMKQGLNAKERELEDWHALVRDVEPNLRIKAVERPEGSQHSVLELVVDDGDGS